MLLINFFASLQTNQQMNLVWIIADSINLIFLIQVTVKGLDFIDHCLSTISFSFYFMFKKLNSFLNLQNKKLSNKEFLSLASKLTVFRREHNRITSILIFANKSLFDPALFSILAIGFPLNSATLILLVTGKMPETCREFMHFAYIVGLAYTIIIATIISTCNSSIYSCQKYLVSLQYGLGRSQLRDKIRHQQFYELVHYKRDFGISLGLFGELTKRKMFEVCALVPVVNKTHFDNQLFYRQVLYILDTYYIFAKSSSK